MYFRRTLFGKYICICILCILAGFLLLGSLVVIVIGRNWVEDKRELLTQNATVISDFVSRNTKAQIENQTLIFRKDDLLLLEKVMETISTGVESNIYIVNSKGSVLISSDVYSKENLVMPQPIEAQILKGNLFTVGTLGDFFSSNHYIAAMPFYARTSFGESAIVGTIICASPTKAFTEYMRELISIFIFVAILTFILVACTVGVYTYRFVTPLQQMSDAARSFAEGDFSKRVKVKSNDEIADLCISFNNMANSLSVSEGVRRNFIANVSHELKTPMTTIAGFVDGILDGTIPKDKQTEYLEIVSNEIKRLSRMVRSMLALSRIDSEDFKLNYSEFNITDIISRIIINFVPQIEDKNITIVGLEDVENILLYGDEDMLYQVFYNLIENAVKFTNIGGTITISINKNNNNFYIDIQNSGQGIENDDVKYIFDKFYKTDKSRSKDKFGMGLGLYIVKTIVNIHKGNITVSSVPQQYACFKVTLPLRINIQNDNFNNSI